MALTQISTQGIKDGTITGSDLATNVDLVDNQKLRLGTGNDLQIYFDGSNSFIKEPNSVAGQLIIDGYNGTDIRQGATGELMGRFLGGGSVELYHNNTKTFETTGEGVTFDTGSSSCVVRLTSNTDAITVLQAFNSDFLIKAPSGGGVSILTNANESSINCISNGAVELYHDNSRRFYTTTNGAIVESGTANFEVYSTTDDQEAKITIIGKTASGGVGQAGRVVIAAESTNNSNGASSMHLRTRKTNNTVTTAITIDKDQDVTLPIDNQKLRFGASQDLQIFHDSVDNHIKGTGNHLMRFWTNNTIRWNILNDGHFRPETDNSLDIGASNQRVRSIFASNALDMSDNAKVQLGNSDDLQIFHDGSNSFIKHNGEGDFYVQTSEASVEDLYLQAGNDLFLRVQTGEFAVKCIGNGGVEQYFNNILKTETTNSGLRVHGHIDIEDNDQIRIGTGDDLRLYHISGNSFIENVTGELIVNGNTIHLKDGGNNETLLKAIANGGVELYHNNSKKFDTTTYGVKVTGRLAATTSITGADNVQIKLGDSDDLQIFHNTAGGVNRNDIVAASGTGIKIETAGNNILELNTNSENSILCRPNGAVELYHDNVKKMETTNVGISSLDTLISHGEIRPASDNNHSIGRSNRRYITYFGVNGSINTSDKNEKNTIIDSDLGLDFINKLKPISYKWNKDDGKTHYGLIAQDLEETLTSLGKTIADFGGIYKEDESPMGLGYSELIAPLIKAVQELSAEVASLKAS